MFPFRSFRAEKPTGGASLSTLRFCEADGFEGSYDFVLDISIVARDRSNESGSRPSPFPFAKGFRPPMPLPSLLDLFDQECSIQVWREGMYTLGVQSEHQHQQQQPRGCWSKYFLEVDGIPLAFNKHVRWVNDPPCVFDRQSLAVAACNLQRPPHLNGNRDEVHGSGHHPKSTAIIYLMCGDVISLKLKPKRMRSRY